MPGYETERFVNLSQNDRAELICSICQDIFCSPIVAQCCQQSFCEDCINDWLKNNNTCPYDRKTLTSSGLTRPPRVMLNMLGKLKIRCDFKENGCKEVVLLENLSQHTVKCRYNVEKVKKKCKKCLSEIPEKSSHDCIKTLLELNRKANEEIETLKRNSSAKLVSPIVPSSALLAQNSLREQSLLREIRELKAEKENFLKTIQNLSNIPEQQKNSKSNIFSSKAQNVNNNDTKLLITSSDISEQEIFNQARKSLWNPEVEKNDLSKDMTNKVMSIVRDEIKEYNSVFVVCKNIVEKLNTEYGSRWHCIGCHQKPIKSFYTYENNCQIKLKFAELYLEIYKTQFLNVQQLRQRFRSGKIKREIQIMRTDMKQSMISDVKKITFGAIEKSNSLTDISSELKTQMDKRYPGKWQCFIFAYFGVFGIQYTCGTFISFELDSLNVTLFQAIA